MMGGVSRFLFGRQYVVCMGGVEVFAAPFQGAEAEAPAARLREGTKVMVVAQRRDWLKVPIDLSLSLRCVCVSLSQCLISHITRL